MKPKRKTCLVLRMVGSSNPARLVRKMYSSNRKPDGKVYWDRIKVMNDVEENEHHIESSKTQKYHGDKY